MSNIRKIIVGDSYTYNIKYVKGAEYKVGGRKVTLTDFITKKDSPKILIYVSDGKSKFLWKSINEEPLEVEYDVNFE